MTPTHAGAQTLLLSDSYWDGLLTDLTGAYLVDLDFSNSKLFHAEFRNAQFYGTTRFDGAQFHDRAMFDSANFEGNVSFGRAQFHSAAIFVEANFQGRAMFDSASFHEIAWFVGAQFHGSTLFDRGTHFYQATSFSRAYFHGSVLFTDAYFNEDTSFTEAQFHNETLFIRAQFNSNPPDLTNATASSQHIHRNVWPKPWHTLPVSSDGEMAALVLSPGQG